MLYIQFPIKTLPPNTPHEQLKHKRLITIILCFNYISWLSSRSDGHNSPLYMACHTHTDFPLVSNVCNTAVYILPELGYSSTLSVWVSEGTVEFQPSTLLSGCNTTEVPVSSYTVWNPSDSRYHSRVAVPHFSLSWYRCSSQEVCRPRWLRFVGEDTACSVPYESTVPDDSPHCSCCRNCRTYFGRRLVLQRLIPKVNKLQVNDTV